MRAFALAALAVALAGVPAGCRKRAARFAGPMGDAFTGGVVHDGKPVRFPDDETATLKVFHERGQSFGIPLQADGSFRIGPMPLGSYSATLNRVKKTGAAGKPAPPPYPVPGGFTTEPGKTEYQIELGKGWKL